MEGRAECRRGKEAEEHRQECREMVLLASLEEDVGGRHAHGALCEVDYTGAPIHEDKAHTRDGIERASTQSENGESKDIAHGAAAPGMLVASFVRSVSRQPERTISYRATASRNRSSNGIGPADPRSGHPRALE